MAVNEDLRRRALRARELGGFLTEAKDRKVAQSFAEELDAAAELRAKRIRI